MRKTTKQPVALESQEQVALMQWAELQKGRYPELALLYHIPNGGSRNIIEAARLKAQGVKAGVPDLFLPVARGGCHGLYIELKRTKGGIISDLQTQWIESLLQEGYSVSVCAGWEAAATLILQYLSGGIKSSE